MKITVAITAQGDDGVRTTLEFTEDQWGLGNRDDRPIGKVRSAVLRRTREGVDRLIAREAR